MAAKLPRADAPGAGAFLAVSVLLEPWRYLLRKPENKHRKANILLGRLAPAGTTGSWLPRGIESEANIPGVSRSCPAA